MMSYDELQVWAYPCVAPPLVLITPMADSKMAKHCFVLDWPAELLPNQEWFERKKKEKKGKAEPRKRKCTAAEYSNAWQIIADIATDDLQALLEAIAPRRFHKGYTEGKAREALMACIYKGTQQGPGASISHKVRAMFTQIMTMYAADLGNPLQQEGMTLAGIWEDFKEQWGTKSAEVEWSLEEDGDTQAIRFNGELIALPPSESGFEWSMVNDDNDVPTLSDGVDFYDVTDFLSALRPDAFKQSAVPFELVDFTNHSRMNCKNVQVVAQRPCLVGSQTLELGEKLLMHRTRAL